jgi:hypothetical protein
MVSDFLILPCSRILLQLKQGWFDFTENSFSRKQSFVVWYFTCPDDKRSGNGEEK